jgi:hypothetical protein
MAGKKKKVTPPPMVAPRTKAPKDMARPQPLSLKKQVIREAKKIGLDKAIKNIKNIGSTTPVKEAEQQMLNNFRGSAAERAGLSFDEYKKLVQGKK